ERCHGDDKAVLEVKQEVALREHRLVADEAEGLGIGEREWRAEDRPALLERVDDDDEDRKEGDYRIGDEDRVSGHAAPGRGAGAAHGAILPGRRPFAPPSVLSLSKGPDISPSRGEISCLPALRQSSNNRRCTRGRPISLLEGEM